MMSQIVVSRLLAALSVSSAQRARKPERVTVKTMALKIGL